MIDLERIERYNKIIYLLITCSFIFFLYYIFRDFIFVFLGLTLICMFIISNIINIFEAKGVTVELICSDYYIKRNEENTLMLKLVNNKIFPVMNFVAEIELNNEYTDESEIFFINTSIGAFEKNKIINVNFTPLLCGNVTMKVKNAVVYDILSLFDKKIKTDSKCTVSVIPSQTDNIFTIENMELNAEEEDESSKKNTGGTDTIDIKEYQNGDSFKDIHWKLSAKNDELLIKKKGSDNIDKIVFVFEIKKDIINETMDAVYAFLLQAINDNKTILVGWANGSRLAQATVQNESELYGLFKVIYSSSGTGNALSVARKSSISGNILYMKSPYEEPKVVCV